MSSSLDHVPRFARRIWVVVAIVPAVTVAITDELRVFVRSVRLAVREEIASAREFWK
jgi:hypothetical protein